MSDGLIEWEQESSVPLSVPLEYRNTLQAMRKSSDVLIVTIRMKEKAYKKGTVDQHRKFFAKVNEIVKETGQDQETVAREMKIFAIPFGYPCEKDECGHPLEDEYGRFVPVSTKEATVEQMDILIKSTLDWAFENGFYLEGR